jgi:hypothetical protein
MEGWNTPEEQQKSEKIGKRTFWRNVKRGDYYTRYIRSPLGGGRGGRRLLVRSITQNAMNNGPDHAQKEHSSEIFLRLVVELTVKIG